MGRTGQAASPAWYHNLVANPGVTVEVGPETFGGIAAVAVGEERRGRCGRGCRRTVRWTPTAPGDLTSFHINGGFKLNLFRGNMICAVLHDPFRVRLDRAGLADVIQLWFSAGTGMDVLANGGLRG
jgi:hypothetical protein